MRVWLLSWTSDLWTHFHWRLFFFMDFMNGLSIEINIRYNSLLYGLRSRIAMWQTHLKVRIAKTMPNRCIDWIWANGWQYNDRPLCCTRLPKKTPNPTPRERERKNRAKQRMWDGTKRSWIWVFANGRRRRHTAPHPAQYMLRYYGMKRAKGKIYHIANIFRSHETKQTAKKTPSDFNQTTKRIDIYIESEQKKRRTLCCDAMMIVMMMM